VLIGVGPLKAFLFLNLGSLSGGATLRRIACAGPWRIRVKCVVAWRSGVTGAGRGGRSLWHSPRYGSYRSAVWRQCAAMAAPHGVCRQRRGSGGHRCRDLYTRARIMGAVMKIGQRLRRSRALRFKPPCATASAQRAKVCELRKALCPRSAKANPISVAMGGPHSVLAVQRRARARISRSGAPCVAICARHAPAPVRHAAGVQKTIRASASAASTAYPQSLAGPSWPRFRTADQARGAAFRCGISAEVSVSNRFDYRQSIAKPNLLAGRAHPQQQVPAPSDCPTPVAGSHRLPERRTGDYCAVLRQPDHDSTRPIARRPIGSAQHGYRLSPAQLQVRAGGQIDHAFAMGARQRSTRHIGQGLTAPYGTRSPHHEGPVPDIIRAAAHRAQPAKDLRCAHARAFPIRRGTEVGGAMTKAPARCNASKTARATRQACGLAFLHKVDKSFAPSVWHRHQGRTGGRHNARQMRKGGK